MCRENNEKCAVFRFLCQVIQHCAAAKWTDWSVGASKRRTKSEPPAAAGGPLRNSDCRFPNSDFRRIRDWFCSSLTSLASKDLRSEI